jgi:hypothetical protein
MPLPYIVAAITTKASRPVRFAYQGTHSTAQEAQEQVIAEKMMQRFRFWRTQLDAGMEPAADGGEEFYLASDVDARIAELEKALRDAECWIPNDVNTPTARALRERISSLMDSKAQ